MRDLNVLDEYWNSLPLLLDKSQDVYWVANNDYSVQRYVNPAFQKIWGYDLSHLYENPLFWLETIIDEDKQRLASISRLPHSLVMSHYQEKYRIIRADGQVRWVEDNTYPILDHIGQCIGYAGIAKDITQLFDLHHELEIANKFLPKLAERMEHSVFWVRDPSLKNQLYLSKSFEKIWGMSIDSLYSHPEIWQETIVSEDQKRDVGGLLAALDLKGEQSQFTEIYRIKRPTGEIRWIRDKGFPIFEPATRVCIGFAGIAEDITQQKLCEIELQQAKEKAEAASIGISNFIAGMSHDFRTPLNGLLGMAEILRSGRCYPEQKEHIDAILQAGNTLLDLVEDIINFAALGLNKLPIKEEWFNLEKLTKEIILTISPQALEKKVQIILNYPESAPKEVFGDSSRVRRILMNLANNAVKFTNNGHVLINVELLKESKNKQWLQFVVEDTGIGISKENFEYIFGSFNRVDPSYRGRYKGTGLGLTIVKQFVKDLGGKIKLVSHLNQGSVFYCSVPFKVVPKPLIIEGSEHYTQLRTLVIDDQVKRANTFVKQFSFKNAAVMTSEMLGEILKEGSQALAQYQLILVDDQAKTDILKLAKLIRSKYQSYLILLSDKDSNRTFIKIKKAGYDDCITKPLQPLVIIKTFENAAASLASLANKERLKKSALNVLLVEDDLLTQKITRWMLEELNCKITIASDGKMALDFLTNAYDLIMMDVGLPDMDGISLAERIRSHYPQHNQTPIVALTAHVMDMDKEKCLAAGMNDFLKKPLFKKDLKRLLLRLF